MKKAKIKLSLGREDVRHLNIIGNSAAGSYQTTNTCTAQTGGSCTFWQTCTRCR